MPVERDRLHRLSELLAPRGPDGAGEWYGEAGRIGIAHRRLAVIDPDRRANQPMSTPDASFVLSYNGEIYNFRALKKNLEAKGHAFLTDSDTEVLLHLYAEYGVEMLKQLRGMFAFIIWDATHRKLLLARDTYGIKPLYYHDDGREFSVSSTVRSLHALDRPPPGAAGQVGYYLFGTVPEPWTLYEGIRSVPAGSYMTVDENGVSAPVRFQRVAELFQPGENADKADALLDSVRHHLVSDVPLGLFLSAGIDSSAILALAKQAETDSLTTVTLQFDEYTGSEDDESPLATEMADRYGAFHHNRRVSEQEFRDELPAILAAMDQPSIDGVNTWFASKAIRETGIKVALSGLGGDELFGGYPSFRNIPLALKWLGVFASLRPVGRGMRRAFRSLQPFWPVSRMNPRYAGVFEYGGFLAGAYLLQRGLFLPDELHHVMDPADVEKGLSELNALAMIQMEDDAELDLQARIAVLESSLCMRNQMLRDTDWAGMAHSVEVRVPLVDCRLTRACADLAGRGKDVLSDNRYLKLPGRITDRPKTGFTTPVGVWLQNHESMQSWRKVPVLADRRCPWARRWSYVMAEHCIGG